jgi:hypothetical protein
MGELLRHRQTKEAETDMFAPKVTAPHLDSTLSGGKLPSRGGSVCLNSLGLPLGGLLPVVTPPPGLAWAG